MSFVVDWDGKDYDIDPNEFSGLELSEVKIRTSLSYRELVRELGAAEADAFRALFWVVDKRENQELKFSEYGGPPPRVYMPVFKDFIDVVTGVLGKAAGVTPTPTTETDGGPTSSSAMDGSPEPSTTL